MPNEERSVHYRTVGTLLVVVACASGGSCSAPGDESFEDPGRGGSRARSRSTGGLSDTRFDPTGVVTVAGPLALDPLIYAEEQRVGPSSDGDSTADDVFGMSVALAGDTAIVGAMFDDVGGEVDQGSAYIVVRSGTSWIPQAKLIASDGTDLDQLGYAVALAGDTALVGAPGHGGSQGAAYVFVRDGASWVQQAKLMASDGTSLDFFGFSVGLAGDTAVVGAEGDDMGRGSAYIFVRNGTTWIQQAKLTASDGEPNDAFGTATALAGDTALVGMFGDDIGGNQDEGSAYVFTRDGATWSQQAKLVAADGASGDWFGTSVALSGDTALIGAEGDDLGAGPLEGSAYVFVRSGASWSQQAKLTASDGDGHAEFGWEVALAGDAALVGASRARIDGHLGQGAAYAFVRDGTVWNQQVKVTAGDGAAEDRFGSSVALWGEPVSGYLTAVGAPGRGGFEGAAYFGRLEQPTRCAGVAPGTTCRRAYGLCDVAETCDGVDARCPDDRRAPSGTECRPATGPCDLAEACDGQSAACPRDAFVASGTECRAAAGLCDAAEVCSGGDAACPADLVLAAGTECRPAAGPCDVHEVCKGVGVDCPRDQFAAAGTECRADIGECAVAGTCTGDGSACPLAQPPTCAEDGGCCDAHGGRVQLWLGLAVIGLLHRRGRRRRLDDGPALAAGRWIPNVRATVNERRARLRDHGRGRGHDARRGPR